MVMMKSSRICRLSTLAPDGQKREARMQRAPPQFRPIVINAPASDDIEEVAGPALKIVRQTSEVCDRPAVSVSLY